MVVSANTSPLGEQKDAEQLRQKYLDQTYGSNAPAIGKDEGTVIHREVVDMPEPVPDGTGGGTD